jgi:AraC-like DNA-binding protein
MEEMLQATGTQRITILINLLTAIAATPEKSPLSSLGFVQEYNLQRTDKINEIYHYTFNNFTNPISIEEVAKAVHISPHSFCRYFKTRTSKTYFEFLAELRIGYACKLILENEMSMAQVCYSSGFNNVANFNRKFKELTSKTPLQYYKEYALMC